VFVNSFFKKFFKKKFSANTLENESVDQHFDRRFGLKVLAGRKKFSKYLTFFWRCDIIILENKRRKVIIWKKER
jgi:hypothetical protein